MFLQTLCCVKELDNRNSQQKPRGNGRFKNCVYVDGSSKDLWQELTEPFSMMRLSMTTPLLFCSHTISQKCPHVFGKGPCKHTRYTLYNTGHTSTPRSQSVTMFIGGGRVATKAACPTVSHPVPHPICCRVTSAPRCRLSLDLS